MLNTKSTSIDSSTIPVPFFPSFRRFELSDKHWYINFYSQFDPYADFAFGNLFIWLNFNDDLEVSQLNNNVVFRFTNVLDQGSKCTTLIGNQKIDATLDDIFETIGVNELSFVPEIVYSNIDNKTNYILLEERESFDYILDVHRMAFLLGPETRKLRREVRTSLKEYGEHVILRELDMKDQTTINFLINNLHTWDKAFTLSDNDLDRQEVTALEQSLLLADHIENKSFCIYVDGKLEGFILYQCPPQKDYVILNHIKTSYAFRYIFDFMMFAFASRVKQSNIKFINFEQDLGLEGLRTHKLSLKPVAFFKKYTITKA